MRVNQYAHVTIFGSFKTKLQTVHNGMKKAEAT